MLILFRQISGLGKDGLQPGARSVGVLTGCGAAFEQPDGACSSARRPTRLFAVAMFSPRLVGSIADCRGLQGGSCAAAGSVRMSCCAPCRVYPSSVASDSSPHALSYTHSLTHHISHSLPPWVTQVIVKKGEKDLPGLTDEEKPRMRGPKRASKVGVRFPGFRVSRKGSAVKPVRARITVYNATALHRQRRCTASIGTPGFKFFTSFHVHVHVHCALRSIHVHVHDAPRSASCST